MPSDESDSSPKTGIEKMIDFFNSSEINHPVSITEIVDKTGLSWTYVKKLLKGELTKNYVGVNFEKSGNAWIAWKDREKILKKLDNTCGHLLKEPEENEEEQEE